MLPDAAEDVSGHPDDSASAEAVRSHYDVSNEFYALWLGTTMMYSTAIWPAAREAVDLDQAQLRKIDRMAALTGVGPGTRVLDIGCGWGGNLRRLADVHGVVDGVGLTLSNAQQQLVAANPIAGTSVRLEGWSEHESAAPYDAILSFGAFEHFARDGSDARERVAVYRRFFARCFTWLTEGGLLGLETIAHDDAPDTDAPLGRGPLGDNVLQIFPESICPHLNEVVLGFEPYFEVELLESDAPNFARTCRAWMLGLRDNEARANELVGADVVRRFRRYLVASEAQFRMRTITNLRLVLRRRPAVRH